MGNKNIYFGFILLFLVLMIPFTGLSEDVIAYFDEIGGDVTVDRGGVSINARMGMFLTPGDVIRTGEESFATVVFQDDGSRVKLGENALLTLNAKRKKLSLKKKLFLKTGRLWAKVARRRGTEFQVKTPTSVASVKGTRFIIEEQQGGITWLWVLENSVEFSNGKVKVTVNEGEKGKSSKKGIEVNKIEEGDVPIEPGVHNLIFYFKSRDGGEMQKELHLEFEK